MVEIPPRGDEWEVAYDDHGGDIDKNEGINQVEYEKQRLDPKTEKDMKHLWLTIHY